MTDAFYHSKKWKRLRAVVLKRDGYVDQLDLRNGERNPAEVVHHIFPREVYPQYQWAAWNLISLTRDNHEAMHIRITGELSGAGRELMMETAARVGVKADRLILVCGLPGSGKTEYVRRMLGNGVAYDLDYVAAAFRLRTAHDERHDTARRMASSMMRGFAAAARRYGETIFIIRTAPVIDDVVALEPDEIVLCGGVFDISGRKDYRRMDTREMLKRLDDLRGFASANGIPLNVV